MFGICNLHFLHGAWICSKKLNIPYFIRFCALAKHMKASKRDVIENPGHKLDFPKHLKHFNLPHMFAPLGVSWNEYCGASWNGERHALNMYKIINAVSWRTFKKYIWLPVNKIF